MTGQSKIYFGVEDRLNTLKYQHAVAFSGQKILLLILKTQLCGDIFNIIGCVKDKLSTNAQFKNSFTKEEQEILATVPYENWDILLLFKVIQRVCGLEKLGESCWTKQLGSDDCLEYPITSLKDERNKMMHNFLLIINETQLEEQLENLSNLAFKITSALAVCAPLLGKNLSEDEPHRTLQLVLDIIENCKVKINEGPPRTKSLPVAVLEASCSSHSHHDVSETQCQSSQISLLGSSAKYDVSQNQTFSANHAISSYPQHNEAKIRENHIQTLSETNTNIIQIAEDVKTKLFKSYVLNISTQQDIYNMLVNPLRFQHMLSKRTSPWEDINELHDFSIKTEMINSLYHLKVNSEDSDEIEWNMYCRMFHKGQMKFVRMFANYAELIDPWGIIHVTKIPEFFLSNMTALNQIDNIQRFMVEDGYCVPKLDTQYKWPQKSWENVPPLKFLCYNAIYNNIDVLPHFNIKLPPLLAKNVNDFIKVKKWEKES